jgi:hypothetical protein
MRYRIAGKMTMAVITDLTTAKIRRAEVRAG